MLMRYTCFYAFLFLSNILFAQAKFVGVSAVDILSVDSVTILQVHPGGVVIPYLSEEQVIVGSPTNWSKDQLAKKLIVNYNEKNTRFISLGNPQTNRLRKIRDAGTNEMVGYGVEEVTGDFGYFYHDNQLWAYQFSTDSLSEVVSVGEPISSNIIVGEKNIYFAVASKLYCVGIENYEMSLMYEGVDLISRLLNSETGVVLWENEDGIKKINQVDNSIAWSFSPDRANIHTPYLNCSGNKILFSAGDLYCLNASSGELLWRTQERCSKYHYLTRIVGEYALHYNSCFEEGDSPAVLELLDLQTGRVLANGWVSETYPELENFPVSEMDMAGMISFGNLHDNKIVGIRGQKLLWFSLK